VYPRKGNYNTRSMCRITKKTATEEACVAGGGILLEPKRVFHLEENRRRKSMRRYVRKTVRLQACVDAEGIPFQTKRVYVKEMNRSP